jgi:hypothetical protein
LKDFIGRVGDQEAFGDAYTGLVERFEGKPPSSGGAKVQVFWYHGLGGMGKSWLLRRAMGLTAEKFPIVTTALVDWDDPAWRKPNGDAQPANARELCDPIALRLAQLYGGVNHLV